MADLPRSRRLAREMAFQALFACENISELAEVCLSDILERQPLSPVAAGFCKTLVLGVSSLADSLDLTISGYLSSGWGIDRLALTDLVALRLACYELYHLPGIPPKVSISQAVELATKFGTRDSGRFVNGVLGNLYKDSPKVDWDPSQEEVYDPADDVGFEPPTLVDTDEVEGEVEVTPGTPEAEEFDKVGLWVVKTD